jgi:hypothetical protein
MPAPSVEALKATPTEKGVGVASGALAADAPPVSALGVEAKLGETARTANRRATADAKRRAGFKVFLVSLKFPES